MEFKVSPRDEATEKIEGYILKNQLPPHSRIPSERDMCEMWNLNRTTLRSAIQRLINDGKLYNKLGSGTFISPPRVTRYLQDLRSLATYTRESGRVLTTQVYSLTVRECNIKISQRLHIPLGREVYELVRIRKFDGEPTEIDTLYIDHERFPDLERFDFSAESFHNVIQHNYNVHIVGGEERISIAYASALESKLLEIPVETATFYVNGINWDEEETPLIYFKSISRSDKEHFSCILSL